MYPVVFQAYVFLHDSCMLLFTVHICSTPQHTTACCIAICLNEGQHRIQLHFFDIVSKHDKSSLNHFNYSYQIVVKFT